MRAPSPSRSSIFGPPAPSTFIRSYLALLYRHSRSFPVISHLSLKGRGFILSKAHCRMSSLGKNELRHQVKKKGASGRNAPGAQLVPSRARVAFEGQNALCMAAKSQQMCRTVRGAPPGKPAGSAPGLPVHPVTAAAWDMPSQPRLLAPLPSEYCALCRGSLSWGASLTWGPSSNA